MSIKRLLSFFFSACCGKDIVSFAKRNERNIVFGIALISVSVLSFELGILFSEKKKQNVLVIEKPVVSFASNTPETLQQENSIPASQSVAGVQKGKKDPILNKNPADDSKIKSQECAFVGSKNSDKYHSPSCGYAKQIKSENRVCFKDEQEAQQKGYKAGCIQ